MTTTANGMSLRRLAIVLGVSQPFLSQIRAGRRPLPESLKAKLEALGAYHLLIGDKQAESHSESGWMAGLAPDKPKARLVPRAGIEPTPPCGERILSPPRLPFRHLGTAMGSNQKGGAKTSLLVPYGIRLWRRRADSNRRIELLQSSALDLLATSPPGVYFTTSGAEEEI